MLKLYGCIAYSHDIRLVVLAGILCVFASFTTISLLERTRAASPSHRWAWIWASAVASGIGVWATHFVGMLAYRPRLPINYDIEDHDPVDRRRHPGFRIRYRPSPCAAGRGMALIGGAITGLAATTTHYLGMAALEMPAIIRYDDDYLVASILVSIVFYAAAFEGNRRPLSTGSRIFSSGALALGILSLHFMGMAAMSIVPANIAAAPHAVMSPTILAFMVAVMAAAILILSLAGTIVDRHLTHRTMLEASRLKTSERRFVNWPIPPSRASRS